MDRSDVRELHYITPVQNLPSIAQHGLLSHERAALLPHYSVADPQIQDRRVNKKVPGGRRLHEYVNLYFHGRNAMMYKLKSQGHTDIAVIRIYPAVLDVQGVVITDGNAASDSTLFAASPDGLNRLDSSRVLARSWTHNDMFEMWERKRQRCAELLVPDVLPSGWVSGCYVHNTAQVLACNQLVAHWPMEVNPDVFFR